MEGTVGRACFHIRLGSHPSKQVSRRNVTLPFFARGHACTPLWEGCRQTGWKSYDARQTIRCAKPEARDTSEKATSKSRVAAAVNEKSSGRSYPLDVSLMLQRSTHIQPACKTCQTRHRVSNSCARMPQGFPAGVPGVAQICFALPFLTIFVCCCEAGGRVVG